MASLIAFFAAATDVKPRVTLSIRRAGFPTSGTIQTHPSIAAVHAEPTWPGCRLIVATGRPEMQPIHVRIPVLAGAVQVTFVPS